MAFKWTDRETEILKKYYPKGGFAAVREAGLDRSKQSVIARARAFKLKAPRYIRWATSDAIDEAISQFYRTDRSSGGVMKLARRLARPGWWITRRARQMGVLNPRFGAGDWSDAEEEFLHQLAHYSDPIISKKFRAAGYARSATEIRRKRRDVGIRKADGVYGVPELADILGVSRATVNSWIRKGWLRTMPADHLRAHRLCHIRERDVRIFICSYIAHLDLGRVDKFWLIDILIGGKNFIAKAA